MAASADAGVRGVMGAGDGGGNIGVGTGGIDFSAINLDCTCDCCCLFACICCCNWGELGSTALLRMCCDKADPESILGCWQKHM